MNEMMCQCYTPPLDKWGPYESIAAGTEFLGQKTGNDNPSHWALIAKIKKKLYIFWPASFASLVDKIGLIIFASMSCSGRTRLSLLVDDIPNVARLDRPA